MKTFTLAMTAAISFAAVAADPAPAKADCALSETGALPLGDSPVRVTATLKSPPRSAVWLSFDAPPEHRELRWDPTVDPTLTRAVVLPGKPGGMTWTVTAAALREDLQSSDGSAAVITYESSIASDGGKNQFVLTSTLQGSGKDATPRKVATATIEVTCSDTLATMEESVLAAAVEARAGQRGFLEAAVPAPVVEALGLLAEIAVERAKSGALALIRAKLVTPMCEKLSLGSLGLGAATERAFPRTCALLDTMRIDDVLSGGRSLMAAARDDLRLTLLTGAVDRLSRQVSPDAAAVLSLAVDVANRLIDGRGTAGLELELAVGILDRLPWSFGLTPERVARLVSPELVGVVLQLEPAAKALPGCSEPIDRGRCGRSIAQFISKQSPTVLRRLLERLWEKQRAAALALLDRFDDERRAVCAVRLAIAAVKKCSSAGCSAAEVADIIRRPEAHFAATTSFPGAVCWIDERTYRLPENEDFHRVTELAARLLDLHGRMSTLDRRQQAIALVRWLVDTVEVLRGESEVLREATDALVALLEEDYTRAINGGLQVAVRLAGTCPAGMPDALPCQIRGRIRGVLRVVGAVSVYVEAYATTKEMDPAAAREARKEALEAIIDGATDRAERGGDGVWSLGIAPGVSGGFSLAPEPQSEPASSWRDAYGWGGDFQLRLPLGLFYQTLPDSTDEVEVGFHTGIWFADLGQFTRSDRGGEDESVRWNDFVGVGGQLGVLVGSSNQSFLLAAEASWSPTVYERAVTIMREEGGTYTRDLSGAFRLGVILAYYVPLFDLN